MSFSLNEVFRGTGTKFRVFVQSPVLEGFGDPETIWVSSPMGSLQPGPSDARMYSVLPLKKDPYGGDSLPPFRGRCGQPVMPDIDGHFDHVAVDDPGFKCTNMFGVVRRVLDVWETYLGGPINWHFASTHSRLELIPHVPWNNAHFGWGFMECGEGKDDQGVERPFSLNFDVLAHETGHGILFSLAGMPEAGRLTTAFRGFHEHASDVIAMISALHFDSFLDHVLWVTKGDIYGANVLSRIGELSNTRQIRIASNGTKMADVISLATPASKATGKQVHKLGQPLTGAVFDITVQMFLRQLGWMGLLPRGFIDEMRLAARTGKLDQIDRTPISDAYATSHDGFKSALADARDMMGLRLAETWRRLDANNFRYGTLAETLLDVDFEFSGRRNQASIRNCFAWRGIKFRRRIDHTVTPVRLPV